MVALGCVMVDRISMLTNAHINTHISYMRLGLT
jgi:hypothetical protein